jgi:hypothetical protein
MPNFLEYLRQQNIFGPRPPIGNDLPSQGGITGRMPYNPNDYGGIFRSQLPPGPNPIPGPMMGPGVMTSDMEIPADPSMFMPPAMTVSGTTSVGQQMPDPRLSMYDVGPFKPQQFDLETPGVNIPTPGQGMPEPEMDAGQRMRELYQPSDDATRRFEEMIDQYPQEKRPGWLRGIGSLLQEYAYGPQVAERTRQSWRSEPIEDWKNKIAPMQAAATNERYQNVNERTMAYNQMAIELRERAQIAKEKNDERKAEIQQQRANIYAYKARNPGKKFFMPKGGNVQIFDPATGQISDTGIPTGSMTELDKLELAGEQRLDQIAATGEEARETEITRQEGRMELAGERGKQARETRSTPAGGTGKTELPSQTRVRIYNNAQRLRNTRPELAPYIKLGVTGTNDVQVTKPSTGGFFSAAGPTQEQYDEISKAIYGEAVGPANTPPSGAPPSGAGRSSMAGPGPKVPLTTPPPSPVKGWKYVKKGNKWVAVPDTGNPEAGPGEVF